MSVPRRAADAGCVTVVDECDVRGETVEHVDLVDAQCRAGVGNDVLDATLVHGDDVGLSFDHVDAVLLGDGTFGLPDAVELMVFVEHLGVGGVDIFLVDTFRTFVEDTCREAHDLTAHACPGEDDTAGETVDELAALRLVTEAGGGEKLSFVTFPFGCRSKKETVGEVVAEVELLDDVIAETAGAEILQADGLTVGMVVEQILEIFLCPLVDDEHRLALRLFLFLFIRQLALMDLDMVFLREPAQRLGIGELFVLHDERHGITAFATAEAVAGAAGGGDIKRRRLLVVERTEPFVVGSRFLQRDELRHDIHDVCRVLDLFYCLPVNHDCCFVPFVAKIRV